MFTYLWVTATLLEPLPKYGSNNVSFEEYCMIFLFFFLILLILQVAHMQQTCYLQMASTLTNRKNMLK